MPNQTPIESAKAKINEALELLRAELKETIEEVDRLQNSDPEGRPMMLAEERVYDLSMASRAAREALKAIDCLRH